MCELVRCSESVLIHFLPFIDKSKNEATCAAGYNIPNMTSWCPAYLQASSQLTNYYMAQVRDCRSLC